MTKLLKILLYLADKPAFKPDIDAFFGQYTEAMIALGKVLIKHERAEDVLDLCEEIFTQDPNSLAGLHLLVDAMSLRGDTTLLLDRYMTLVANKVPIDHETGRKIINLAVASQQKWVHTGEIEKAYHITQQLTKLLPHADFSKVLDALKFLLFQTHTNQIYQYNREKNRDREFECRLAVWRNPLDATRNSAVRLENVYGLLSCLLCHMPITEERIGLIREILASVPTMPPLDPTTAEGAMVMFARFDFYYRLLFNALHLDNIFGPPVPPSDMPDLTLLSSTCEPLSLGSVQKYIQENHIEVIFFAPTSELYARKYAKPYILSILQACDCKFLIFLCISSKENRQESVIREMAIEDERVIFCKDYNDWLNEGKYLIAPNAEPEPSNTYYGYLSMLRLDYMLATFKLPVLVTGMDTLLKKGVAEMLQRFKGCDVVLNKNLGNASLASCYVYSLVLAYPTPNARIFTAFLHDRIDKQLQKKYQIHSIDQALLVLAKHHMAWNQPDASVGVFDELDINNVMFTSENLIHYRHLFEKFTFVNMFAAGVGSRGVDPTSLVENTQPPKPPSATALEEAALAESPPAEDAGQEPTGTDTPP